MKQILSKEIQKILRSRPKWLNKRQVATELAQAAVKHALDGSAPHLTIILERTEGKVPDKQELSGGGLRIVVEHVKAGNNGGSNGGTSDPDA